MKIADLYAGQVIKGGQLSALISRFEVGKTKNGDPYYMVCLQDSSGEIIAKIWNNDYNPETARIHQKFTDYTNRQKSLVAENTREALTAASLTMPIIVSVAGTVSDYKGTLQLVTNGGLVEQTPSNLIDYFLCPITEQTAKELKEELRGYIAQIESPEIQQIVKLVLNDPVVARDFFVFPAAIGHHHAYRYGLLEHTVQVVRYALALFDTSAEHKKIANRDILIAASIFHDLGKIEEYYYFLSNNVISYNDFGAQHRASSLAIVREILAEHGVRNKYPDILGKIGKVIFEHHGYYGTEQEFKSTKVMESKFVFSADMLSSGLAPAYQN